MILVAFLAVNCLELLTLLLKIFIGSRMGPLGLRARLLCYSVPVHIVLVGTAHETSRVVRRLGDGAGRGLVIFLGKYIALSFRLFFMFITERLDDHGLPGPFLVVPVHIFRRRVMAVVARDTSLSQLRIGDAGGHVYRIYVVQSYCLFSFFLCWFFVVIYIHMKISKPNISNPIQKQVAYLSRILPKGPKDH
jgi:hypothetical protein